jgi:hypothetical protein
MNAIYDINHVQWIHYMDFPLGKYFVCLFVCCNLTLFANRLLEREPVKTQVEIMFKKYWGYLTLLIGNIVHISNHLSMVIQTPSIKIQIHFMYGFLQ